MKVPARLSHLRLPLLYLISVSITKDMRSSNMFIFLSHIILLLNHLLTWTGSYQGVLICSLTMAQSLTHPSSVTGIMPLTTTIVLYSAKTPSINTYGTHRDCWSQPSLEMSLISYMLYLQKTLADKCIEELERKEKQSKDFRNSLEFLKTSPFHPLFPFLG